MHVSPQETVSETPPSPDPHPPFIPAHSQSEGTPDTATPQISPPPKPAPSATFPHKIPKLPPARSEREDRPPPSPVGPMHQRHNSVPVRINHRISTQSIVDYY